MAEKSIYSDELDIILQVWGDKIVKEAQSNLGTLNKDDTRALRKSIQGHAFNSTLEFFMQDYGKWVDMGRNGTKKKYDSDSMFGKPNKASFPPVDSIKKWVQSKPVNPIGGIKLTIDQLTFLIGRKIYTKGIKPTLFFTRPFEDNFDELVINVSNEIARMIELDLKKTA